MCNCKHKAAEFQMANILEVSHVTSSTDATLQPQPQLCRLPLTFCDTYWFKFPPVERLFFYSLPLPKHSLLSSLLPKLKRSLSLALTHFPPLAGTLTWPPDSPKPLILYPSHCGSVSLTVAQSDADLDILCSDQPRDEASFRPLVPHLHVSETGASVISLQLTLFPEKGFCIGVTTHHAILDGKSTTMFVKSWAHFCRDEENPPSSLPPELTPFFDRSVVSDPRGLDMFYLKKWLRFSKHPVPREDPKLFEFTNMLPNRGSPESIVRATFELSRTDLAKLRQKILSELENADKDSLRLSSFVVAFSYTVFCILNATEDEDEDGVSPAMVGCGFAADYRRRLAPPVPENYFGNCVGVEFVVEEVVAMRANVSRVAWRASGLVRRLERDDITEGAEERWEKAVTVKMVRGIGVAGSPKFRDYSVDFGWGRPRKVEIVSGELSMTESRDGSGGIEVGVSLKKHQMEIFSCLFREGLNPNHTILTSNANANACLS